MENLSNEEIQKKMDSLNAEYTKIQKAVASGVKKMYSLSDEYNELRAELEKRGVEKK